MNDETFKINTGNYQDDLLIPSIEDCLRHGGEALYSTQNAICVYEWLGGTETVPLLLKKITYGHNFRQFGGTHRKESAPIDINTMISLEQTAVAIAAGQFELHPKDGSYSDRHMELAEFNAGAILTETPIPKRFVYHNTIVLDVVVDILIAHRQRAVYKPKRIRSGLRDQTMSEVQLVQFGGVVAHINMATHENAFFKTRAAAAQQVGVEDDVFYQYAMAISYCTNIPIPTYYFVEEGPEFWQAFAKLHQFSYSLPKVNTGSSQNVVSLF